MEPSDNPPPADDPAARFRKSQESSAPASAPPAAAARPQTLTRLLEETLTAPVRLGSLFDELAQEPAPGYGLLAVNLAVYWAAMLGLNILHVAIVRPQALQYPQEMMAVVGGVAVLAVLVGGFLVAGAVEAAAVASGASADYARSFQIVSMLAAFAPLQAAVNWLPSAWPLPLLWGAFACAVALERLHRAPPAGARLAMTALAAAGIFAVWTARGAVDRALARNDALVESVSQAGGMAAQVQQLQQAAAAAAPGQLPPASAASSLEMLRAAAASGATTMNAQQLQQIQQSAAGLMKSVQPMLNDPNVMKNMPPQQAEVMRQMNAFLAKVQGDMQSGRPFDPTQIAQFAAAMQKSLPSAQDQAQMTEMIGRLQQAKKNGGAMTAEDQKKLLQMAQSFNPGAAIPPPAAPQP